MRWPFVSRDRYDEQTQELARVRCELVSARAEHLRLWNWTMWRVSGFAPDTTTLPEAYQPKPVPQKAATEKTEMPAMPKSARAVRSDLAKFTAKREEEMSPGHVGPVVGAGPAIVKSHPGQADMAARLNETANEVTKQTATGD
jgi:hypothetical protein